MSSLILEKVSPSATDDPGSLVANKVFIQEGMDVNGNYIDEVTEDNIDELDFLNDSKGATDEINAVVKDATRGLIDEALDEGTIDAATVLVAVNAIFFRQSWKAAFPRSVTDMREFTGVDQVQEVDFMGVNDMEVLWRSVPELDAQVLIAFGSHN